MIYTYDGSFFGYLSAVFDGWHDGVEQIEDICLEAEEASLFSESRFVTAMRPQGLSLFLLCLFVGTEKRWDDLTGLFAEGFLL